jgi:hypothetical protein
MSHGKMGFISLYLLFTLSIGNQVSGTPTGAPVAACSSMSPEHGVPPQTSLSPYVTIPTVINVWIFSSKSIFIVNLFIFIAAFARWICPIDSTSQLNRSFNF